MGGCAINNLAGLMNITCHGFDTNYTNKSVEYLWFDIQFVSYRYASICLRVLVYLMANRLLTVVWHGRCCVVAIALIIARRRCRIIHGQATRKAVVGDGRRGRRCCLVIGYLMLWSADRAVGGRFKGIAMHNILIWFFTICAKEIQLVQQYFHYLFRGSTRTKSFSLGF